MTADRIPNPHYPECTRMRSGAFSKNLALSVNLITRIAPRDNLVLLIKCCDCDRGRGRMPEDPNASIIIWLTLSVYSGKVTRLSWLVNTQIPSKAHRRTAVDPERRRPGLSRINKNAFCGVLEASASVCPPDAQKRRGGSLG